MHKYINITSWVQIFLLFVCIWFHDWPLYIGLIIQQSLISYSFQSICGTPWNFFSHVNMSTDIANVLVLYMLSFLGNALQTSGDSVSTIFPLSFPQQSLGHQCRNCDIDCWNWASHYQLISVLCPDLVVFGCLHLL